ncbi:MAG TPA: hypothetical protein VFX43_03380 [Chitinophagaceae bacterium]|nr:hypothetical protein [Chitinophagaceae bacterium]
MDAAHAGLLHDGMVCAFYTDDRICSSSLLWIGIQPQQKVNKRLLTLP